MIDEEKKVSKEIEQAEKALQQAKARLQRAKSKESQKLRKEDTHRKIVWGGIVKKYFSDSILFDETEMNEILSVALASQDCKEIVQKIKSRSAGYGIYKKPLQEENSHA